MQLCCCTQGLQSEKDAILIGVGTFISMNKIAEFVKRKRKEAGLTQEEFSVRSGLGLRFVRDLEQGKETVRMDKVNTALAMFDMEAVPGRKENDE